MSIVRGVNFTPTCVIFKRCLPGTLLHSHASNRRIKMKYQMHQFYEQLAAAAEENRPFVLAIISGTKGSSPQRIGAKALFFADGRIVGTLGGGCLEAEVHARAKNALQTGQPTTYEMVLDHDFGWDDGLICGGSVAGLILPYAAQSAELWRELVQPKAAREWGVKSDFSIALTQ